MSERDKSASAHLALYRKYRSRNLGEIIGQTQVTDILKSVTNSGKFAHAYLLTGQRGTGKTSVARILAHLINKTEYGSPDIDIIEIDAASNNGVDDVRELRDNVNLAPMRAPRKIYIIDEVHMLSGAAFNALLKTIEEPPAHVVFILATTEIQKMPATILSRVQRFHFRPVPAKIVAGHLRNISDKEKIAVDDDALLLIAERGGGSFRDSITLLDQLSGSDAKITRAVVEETLGLAPNTAIEEIISLIQNHDVIGVVTALSKMRDDGVATGIITEQLIAKLSELAVIKPRLYDLIEKLLEVPKSAQPDVKLTAVLAQFATAGSPVKTVAQKTDDKLAEIIEKKIEKEKSIEPEITSETKQESVEIAIDPHTNFSIATRVIAIESREETVRENSEAEDAGTAPTKINWNDILNEVKKMNEPAVLATLKLANFDYENGELMLYFDKKFHRDKAGKASFRGTLNTAFRNLYEFSPSITIAKTTKPATESENSDIAQIAAIMGGGEIINSVGGV